MRGGEVLVSWNASRKRFFALHTTAVLSCKLRLLHAAGNSAGVEEWTARSAEPDGVLALQQHYAMALLCLWSCFARHARHAILKYAISVDLHAPAGGHTTSLGCTSHTGVPQVSQCTHCSPSLPRQQLGCKGGGCSMHVCSRCALLIAPQVGY
jgi:hypothetical protein